MKGRTPNAKEKAFHDDLCRHVGCIACLIDGNRNTYVSVHHTEGRTKEDAHKLVLPLCAGHHQDGTGVPGLIAVHPYKARFEAKYGKQRTLIDLCLDILDRQGITQHRGLFQ